MADTYIKFSDLKDTHPSPIDGAHDLLAIAHKDAQTDDYVSMTVTPNDVGSHAVEDMTFSNLKTSSKTVRTAINQTISNLADDYSSSSTYALNDCVLYEGLLYKCTTAISTPEEWTLAHWTQIKAVDVGSGGGGGANTWEGTQAEYDAIANPDPDTIYFITDGNPIPYTENKSQSGRTPIEFSLPGTSGKTTRITITGTVYAPSALLGFDATVGTISNSDLTTTETSSYHWSYVLSFDITCGMADGRIIYNGALNDGSQVTATLSYYVSGSSTPIHNYSSIEQIVGTWIDGRAVYEKTVYNAGGLSGDFFISHGITNLDRVISCQGSYYDTNAGTSGAIGVVPRIENNLIGITTFTSTDIQIRVPTIFSTRITDWYFVIRYVKTAT